MPRLHATRLVLSLLLCSLSACGCDPSPGPDDAGAVDAGAMDAGFDGGLDPGPDAGPDAGAPPDAGQGPTRVTFELDPSPGEVAAPQVSFIAEVPFTNLSASVVGDGKASLTFDEVLAPEILLLRNIGGVVEGVAAVPLPPIDALPPPVAPDAGASPSAYVVPLDATAYLVPASVQGRLLREAEAAPDAHGGLLVGVVGRPFRAVTSADGRFVLRGLPPGTHDLVAWGPGLRPLRLPGVVLAAAERRYLDPLRLPPATATQGRVTGAFSIRPSEQPQRTLRGIARPVGTTAEPLPLTLEADGTFDATLPAGLYELRGELASDSGDTGGPVQVVRVPNVVVGEDTVALPTCTIFQAGRLSPDPLLPDAGSVVEGWDERWDPEEAPTVLLRAPAYVLPDAVVQLDASTSHAAATPAGLLLTFSWRQTAGEPVPGGVTSNDSAAAARTSFRAPSTTGPLEFTLTVRDTRTGAETAVKHVLRVAAAPTLRVSPEFRSVVVGASTTFVAAVDSGGLPASVRWSSVSGAVAGLSPAVEGVSLTLTAPTVAGSYPIQVEATIGDDVRTEASVLLVVSDEPSAPELFVGADRFVSSGALVEFSASVFGTEPLDLSWVQVSGTPVTLLNPGTASASFIAPSQAGLLRFRATASNPVGTVVRELGVTVLDTSAPVRIGGDPAQDEGSGSWLALRLQYDEPLDPATAASGNVTLRDVFANTVDATVTYDGARNTIHVVPRTPLASGQRYQLRIVGLRDRAFPPNEAGVEVIDFTARVPSWTTYTSTETGTAPPAPGLVVRPGGASVRIVAGRDTPGCRGSWWLDPQAGGALVEPAGAPCHGFDPSRVPVDRRGFSTPGTAFANLETATDGVGGLIATVEGAGPATFTPALPGLFTDATTLYSAHASGALVRLRGFVGGAWGSPGEVVTNAVDAGALAIEAASGTSVGLRLHVAAIEQHDTSRRLLVRRRLGSVGWEVLPGREAGGAVDANVVPGSVVRMAATRNEPVVAAHVNVGAERRLMVAVFTSTVSPGSWSAFRNAASDNGGATAFDLVVRGDTAFVPVVADGRLRLRRIDFFTQPGFPTTVMGPTGEVLNVDPACTADHPELVSVPDRLWLTWHERCADGAYRVYLRSIE